jgi:hypothetical protein
MFYNYVFKHIKIIEKIFVCIIIIYIFVVFKEMSKTKKMKY